MELKTVDEHFRELLRFIAEPGLSPASRRDLWVGALEALDKALAEGRITHNGKVIHSLPKVIPDENRIPRKKQRRVPVVEIKKNRKVKPGKV